MPDSKSTLRSIPSEKSGATTKPRNTLKPTTFFANRKKTHPLGLSILVPVYNASPFLRGCLDSIRAQTFTNFEVICVNDGSTDDSLAILKEYTSKDKRFKILDKKNSGYGDSLNQALKLAKGDYVGIVEPDDFLEKDMYEKLLSFANRQLTLATSKPDKSNHSTSPESQIDIAKASYFNFYGQTGKNIPEKIFISGEDGKVLNPREYQSIFLVNPTIWSAIYRREMLEARQIDFQPTPGASYQDIGFAFKTFAAAETVYCTNLPLYHYRRDNFAASSAKSSAKIFAVKREYDGLKPPTELFTTACLCRFRSYLWNYNRLTFSAALKFARTAKKDYQKLHKKGFRIKSFTGLARAGESKFATKHPVAYVYLRPLFRFKNWLQTCLVNLLKGQK